VPRHALTVLKSLATCQDMFLQCRRVLDMLQKSEQISHNCVGLGGGSCRVNTLLQPCGLLLSVQDQRLISPLEGVTTIFLAHQNPQPTAY
jgi:hypothetical protein